MPSEPTFNELRIFTASPSDVATERAKVETVTAALKPFADFTGVASETLNWRKVHQIIYWGLEYEYILWFLLVITFFVTQSIRNLKIQELLST